MSKYHYVSHIASAAYCEQKAVFDRTLGERSPLDIKAKAVMGTFEHARFEMEGRLQAATDRRCFVASYVYGPDAPETDLLRLWRDRVLAPSVAGRLVIKSYYAISPPLVGLFSHSRILTALVRQMLGLFLHRISEPQ